MKITRRQIKRLVEAIFIGDTDGTVLSPKDVDDLEYSGVEKDDMSRGYHPKLDALRSTNPKQARSLAVSLGLQDDLTPYEELAVDHIDDKLIHSPRTPAEQPREQQRLLLMRDPALKRIVEDFTIDFVNYILSPEGVEIAKEVIKELLYNQESGITPGPIEWSKVNWGVGIVYLTRGFNLGERIQQKLNIKYDGLEKLKKYRALYHYLGNKLEKIAQQRFNKEFAEVLIDEIKGKSFPLALTEAALRRLIVEAFEQRVPVFAPVTQDEIDKLRQKGRQDADLSDLSAKQKASLQRLSQEDPNVERQIYQTLGSSEPEITTDEEEAFLAGQNLMLQDMSEFNLMQAYYGEYANYLKPHQISLLAKAFNKNLYLDVDTNVGVSVRDYQDLYIDAQTYDDMARQIALKKKNPSQAELRNVSDGDDEHIRAVQGLARRIIKASNSTTMYASDLDIIDIGRLDEYEKPYNLIDHTGHKYARLILHPLYEKENKDVINLINTGKITLLY